MQSSGTRQRALRPGPPHGGRPTLFAVLVPLAVLALLALLAPGALAQQPDSAAAEARPTVAPEAFVAVDTIMVLEDREGLVWGDWYVNPEIGVQVQHAIERRGQLSGRMWLESAAPIRDLAIARPAPRAQVLSFSDKGVLLGFWQPGEVEYRWVFEGPWRLKAGGVARPGDVIGATSRVGITLPLPTPPSRSTEARDRVGRLDVTYRPRTSGAGIPRGSFTVYLYYLDSTLGYRIAGVGY